MEDLVFVDTALFEHRFWLQIMGDHTRFIFYSLAPTEVEEIQKVNRFMDVYDQLLDKSRQQLTTIELYELNKRAEEVTYEFRDFKLHLLALTLSKGIKVHLSSSFFNHMMNELEEYILVINAFNASRKPLYHPIHYHLRWLSDAVGHAAGVSANLDEIEKDIITISNGYEKIFTDLYMKSVQLSEYLRTEMNDFPSMDRLNEQVVMTMTAFKEFLEDIRDQRMVNKLLGTLLPLMADHMAREECYYLLKLSLVAGTVKPNCDPAKPRIEA